MALGTKAALVRRAVELDEEAVDERLLAGVLARELGGDFIENVGHRLAHAFTTPTRGVPVAKLDSFVLTGRRPGRYRRTPERPTLEHHFGLYGWIASGVHDLPSENGIDGGHPSPPWSAELLETDPRIPAGKSNPAPGRGPIRAWRGSKLDDGRRRSPPAF